MKRRRYLCGPAGSFCSHSAASCGPSARERAIISSGLSRRKDRGPGLDKHLLIVLDQLGVVEDKIARLHDWDGVIAEGQNTGVLDRPIVRHPLLKSGPGRPGGRSVVFGRE